MKRFFSDLLKRAASEYPSLYAKVNIYNFPFTVSRHDTITMHRLKDVPLGSKLKLTNVREVGSPSVTIKGRPWIGRDLVSVEAVVIEHGRGAKVQAKQPKRRKGHTPLRTIKPLTTTLLIRDIRIEADNQLAEEKGENTGNPINE